MEPIWIHPQVNGCQLQMELDTGSALHNCATAETHKIKSSRTKPIWIHPQVNGCQLQMELDTGSALTDYTSCPPRLTRFATLHRRPMSANFEVFLAW